MVLDHNQKRVLNVFRLLSNASKADVVRRIDLTHPAVTQIVRKLCDMGYLEEKEKKRKGPRGQPATIYSISEKNVFVGIHVGRQQLEFVALGLTGKVLAHEQKKFGFLQKEVLTSRSQQELDRFLAVEPVRDRNIVGVGISTPYFWEGWQNILKTKNIFDQEWNSEIVTELFKVPNVENVIVENDGSSAALGEKTFGAGVEYKDFLYVNIGTFIGGGLVIDGTLRTGAHGNTAALAPFPVSYSTNPSSGDSARPFEQLLSRASLNSLEEYAQRNNYQLDFANIDSNERMEDINYLDKWIKDCSSALAQFFIGVWSIIDIESIILDGALPKPVLQKIIDTTQSHVRDFQIEGIIPCDVKQGEHGLLAQSIGAACLPILSILGPPPIGRIEEEAVLDKSGMQLAS